MIQRFVILQGLGIGLLVAAYLAGGGSLLQASDHVFAGPIIGCLTLAGLCMVATKHFEGAGWLSDKLPVVGLLGTVLGVLLALQNAAGMDADTKRMFIFNGTAESLSSNFLGMLGYAWLSLTLKVCHGKAE